MKAIVKIIPLLAVLGLLLPSRASGAGFDSPMVDAQACRPEAAMPSSGGFLDDRITEALPADEKSKGGKKKKKKDEDEDEDEKKD